MGSTNKTTNYELSQYIGTDKPSWLNDYNNDMLKIDTQMKANATAAGNAQTTANTADGKADTNTQAISTLNTQINTPSTGLAATVADHTTAITGINNTIGNTPLTTAAQTLTGAIEEVKGSIPSVTGTLVFNGIKDITIRADGVKTNAALINDLYNELITYLTTKAAGYRFQIVKITIQGVLTAYSLDASYKDKSFSAAFRCISLEATNHIYITDVYSYSTSSSLHSVTDSTISDISSTVPSADTAFTISLNEFTLN